MHAGIQTGRTDRRAQMKFNHITQMYYFILSLIHITFLSDEYFYFVIYDGPHRHPTYVGALDFELWPCFVKIIFFG